MKKTFALLLALAMLLICLPVTAFAATVITRVELTINLPVAGQTVPNNCAIHSNGYTIYAIDWEEIGGRGYLEAGSTFQEGYTYEATVWAKAADGYEFSYADDRTPAITGYINGSEVPVTKAYEYKAWAMVCLTVRFQNIPAKGWVKDVNLLVPTPAAGENPSYEQLVGTGYTTANVYFGSSTNEDMQNGIAWYDSSHNYLKPGQGKFAQNTAYTFHCLVFPTEGYRIWEDATVYVNGKEAEASLDYDTFLAVNYTFPATGHAAHQHVYTDWQYNFGQHYKNCTVDGCDDVFFVEAHKGGNATCEQDGICSVCGYAYIEASEEYHVPDTSKWVARVDMYHFHPCTICGAHCDIEDHRWSPTYLYKDSSGHAWICADCGANSAIEKHNPGTAATETTPQTCQDCDYIIQPAINHTHNLTKVPQTAATCTQEGNIEYYLCSGCNDCFTDAEAKSKIPENTSLKIDALGHNASQVWSMDASSHWQVCTTCNQVLDETKEQHNAVNGKCTTCNYVISSGDTDPGAAPTEDIPDNPNGPTTGEKNSHVWLPILLVGLVCFTAAITVTVICLKIKKQKGECQ